MISPESLADFIQIMLEDYGIKLSDKQAYQDATAFLEAFKILTTGTSLIQKKPIDSQEEERVNVP